MAGKGSYLGGSSIIRPTAKPSKSWAEEHDFAYGERSFLSNSQIGSQIQGIENRLRVETQKNMAKAAKSQSRRLVKQIWFADHYDPERIKLVTDLIVVELADLFIKMTMELEGPFVQERIQRWSKIAVKRAQLIWRQQIGGTV